MAALEPLALASSRRRDERRGWTGTIRKGDIFIHFVRQAIVSVKLLQPCDKASESGLRMARSLSPTSSIAHFPTTNTLSWSLSSRPGSQPAQCSDAAAVDGRLSTKAAEASRKRPTPTDTARGAVVATSTPEAVIEATATTLAPVGMARSRRQARTGGPSRG